MTGAGADAALPDIIDRTFGKLIGLPCWRVHWQANLGLDISFGEPVMTIREPYKTESKSAVVRQLAAHRGVTVKGEWWWWAQCGRWSLTLADEKLAVTQADSLRRKRRTLARLDGQALLGVGFNRETSATELTFDLGATLRIRGSCCDDGSMYMLYTPTHVLEVCSGGRVRHVPRVVK